MRRALLLTVALAPAIGCSTAAQHPELVARVSQVRVVRDPESVRGCSFLRVVSAAEDPGYTTSRGLQLVAGTPAITTLQLRALQAGGDTVEVTNSEQSYRAGAGWARALTTLMGNAYRCAQGVGQASPSIAPNRPDQGLGGERVTVVSLRFAPVGDVEIPVPPADSVTAARPIRITPMTDARKLADLSVIGGNHEAGRVSIPAKSAGSVAEFASETLQKCLKIWGVNTSPEADIVLKGEIATLFVAEGNRYEGTVHLRFRLERPDGSLLSEGIEVGEDSTWGRSLAAYNYNQVASTMLARAYSNLLSDPGFLKARGAKQDKRGGTVVDAAVLKANIVALMREGISTDVIARYVGSQKLSQPLAAEEILAWKKDGISDEVIKAALSETRPKE
jgi:hypothetical protein